MSGTIKTPPFVDGDISQANRVMAEWLNDVNVGIFTAIGDGTNPPTTPAIVRTNLSIPGTAAARSSNTILAAGDRSKVFVGTSTFTQTFTAAATLGASWYCTYINAGTGIITLDPNSTELIDGVVTQVLLPGDSCTIICDGTGFYTIGLPLVRTISRVTTPVQVISALSGTLFTIAIPPNLLRTDRRLIVEGWGDFLNNTGGNDYYVLRLGYGGSNFMDTSAGTYGTNAARRAWRFLAILQGAGATNAQLGIATRWTGAVDTSGAAMSTSGDFVTTATSPALAIDSTASQNLVLTGLLGNSSANLAVRLQGAYVSIS